MESIRNYVETLFAGLPQRGEQAGEHTVEQLRQLGGGIALDPHDRRDLLRRVDDRRSSGGGCRVAHQPSSPRCCARRTFLSSLPTEVRGS